MSEEDVGSDIFTPLGSKWRLPCACQLLPPPTSFHLGPQTIGGSCLCSFSFSPCLTCQSILETPDRHMQVHLGRSKHLLIQSNWQRRPAMEACVLITSHPLYQLRLLCHHSMRWTSTEHWTLDIWCWWQWVSHLYSQSWKEGRHTLHGSAQGGT